MRRSNKKVTTYFILFSLLLIGVVYAILQANLQINGVAKIQANTWDIHFDNIQVNANSVSIGENDSQATIDPENNCKVDFEVTLSIPGDFYEFTIDVVNAGTIDGMIGELNKTLKVNNEVVSTIPNYLEYSITYEDESNILENHLLRSGTTEKYKVLLKYRYDIEELPEAATISTSLEPQFIQADNSAFERPISMLVDGKSFNTKIKQLSGSSSETYNATNLSITAFKKSKTPPDMNSMKSNNIVSVSLDNPVYAWFDDGTIYYYSDSYIIYLNEDSSYMFNKIYNISDIELDSVITSKTVDMSYLFYEAAYNVETVNLDLSNWNTSKVTNMEKMFYSTGRNAKTLSIGDISNWDTSNVTNMYGMFYSLGDYSTTLNLDLSNWKTSKVTNMSMLFYSTGFHSTTWSIGDLSNWDTSNVTDMSNMFRYAGYTSTNWNIGNLSNWDTSNVTDMSNMFAYAGYTSTSWGIGDLSNWDTAKVTDMSYMFADAGSKTAVWNSIGNLNIYANDINHMFLRSSGANVTLNIYNNPSSYNGTFINAARLSGSEITVNYTSDVTDIDNIIATKNSSRVVKGNLFTP